jgi:hypothetical protein
MSSSAQTFFGYPAVPPVERWSECTLERALERAESPLARHHSRQYSTITISTVINMGELLEHV